MAERIRERLAASRFDVGEESVVVTASIGIAGIESIEAEDGLSPASLIDRADQALYSAKHHGRNRVEMWSVARHGTRAAYSVAVATPFLVAGAIAIGGVPLALLALLALPLAIRPTRLVRSGAEGRDLIPALAGTGLLLLGYAVALSVGIVLAAA